MPGVKHNNSITGAVRKILQNLKTASSLEIRAILDLTDTAGGNKVRWALKDLADKGHAIRIEDGLYKYSELENQVPKKIGTMWRGIWCSKRFTVSEIMLLSSAGRSYVQKFIRYLLAEEYITKLDRKKDNEWQYQVTAKATPKIPLFSMKKSIKEEKECKPLEDKAFELVRLVLKKDKKLNTQIGIVVKELNELMGVRDE